MSWRDTLSQASFRGVPFKAKGHSGAVGGQRTATHETPGKDGAYIEPLGAKGHEFTVDAYIDGADYAIGRDRLIEACNAGGDGLLVHPYFGEVTVVCTECRVSESSREGRIARFSLTFARQGAQRYPRRRADTAAAIGDAADNADSASTDAFAADYSVAGEPGFVEADAVAGTADFADVVAQESAGASIAFETAEMALALAGDAVGLVRDPPSLAAGIRSFLAGVGDGIMARLGITALTGMFDRIGDVVDIGAADAATASSALSGAPGRARLAANRSAFAGLVRRQTVIDLARRASIATPRTTDEAVRLRDEIGARLDREIEVADDDTYRRLVDLRTATVLHLNRIAPSLARTARVPVRATVPALVLAYRIHADAAREDEIVTRNGLSHPGFVPGGDMVEVLIDG